MPRIGLSEGPETKPLMRSSCRVGEHCVHVNGQRPKDRQDQKAKQPLEAPNRLSAFNSTHLRSQLISRPSDERHLKPEPTISLEQITSQLRITLQALFAQK